MSWLGGLFIALGLVYAADRVADAINSIRNETAGGGPTGPTGVTGKTTATLGEDSQRRQRVQS